MHAFFLLPRLQRPEEFVCRGYDCSLVRRDCPHLYCLSHSIAASALDCRCMYAVEYGERLLSDERLLCDWIAGCARADASELQLFRIVAQSRLA